MTWLIFSAGVQHESGKPYPCVMTANYACSVIIGLLAVGVEGHCTHSNVGFNIGAIGYRKAAIEVCSCILTVKHRVLTSMLSSGV